LKACFAAEVVGDQEELVAANEDPVDSVSATTPSDATKASEKYKSKSTAAGEVSHAPFAGEYGMLLVGVPFSVMRIGVPTSLLPHLFADSVVKENVAAALM
jgi:hypothetical protein